MFEQIAGLFQSRQNDAQSDGSSTPTSTTTTTTANLWSFEDTEAYRKFRSQVALRRVIVDEDDSKMWSYYETGPKEVRYPLVFLPPVSGSGDVFYQQMMYLSQRGHRVISLEYPAYYTLEEFLIGFRRLLRRFQVLGIHLFGASLGGFLAQKFTERCSPGLVRSLILCNTFGDTSRFKLVNTVSLFWFAPAPILRSLFIKNKVPEDADEHIQAAGRFMSKRLANLSQSELISRLMLNLTDSFVQPERLQTMVVTIIDVFDLCANSEATRSELYKLYPSARLAHLESGGNYPYLSRADEVNMHLLVHLRKFDGTPYCANVHHCVEFDPDSHQVGEEVIPEPQSAHQEVPRESESVDEQKIVETHEESVEADKVDYQEKLETSTSQEPQEIEDEQDKTSTQPN